GSVRDAFGRVEMAQLVLSAAGREAERSGAEADAAAEATRDADQAARGQVVTVGEVSAASEEIEGLLARAQARVDSLEGQATQLEAAEQARAELEAARQRAAQSSAGLGQRVTAQSVPADYRALYQRAAGRCPGMRWTLLAAVGQVESGHGRNNGPSSAGAVGPMQFLPATFASYGADGDGDGVADPWNPADAVPTAADYLCEGGGGGDESGVRRALFRYNHAQWYVDLVLGVERALVASGV
ncbi:MAG: lytic murein transglycosylase, partial [Actinomycetes bacterium]